MASADDGSNQLEEHSDPTVAEAVASQDVGEARTSTNDDDARESAGAPERASQGDTDLQALEGNATWTSTHDSAPHAQADPPSAPEGGADRPSAGAPASSEHGQSAPADNAANAADVLTIRELPDVYDTADFAGSPTPQQLPPGCVRLAAVNHFVSSKANNLHALDADTLLTTAGNAVVFYRTADGATTFLPGLDGGGVACIALHPTQPLFLVAEKCKRRAPNVYIYRHLGGGAAELHRVLRGGTERAYSAAAFRPDGATLATVGSAPDYMLTIWDWRAERVVLRCKAFSQEVYALAFSPRLDGHLVTAGTGHIRFWKMASTFTGLKLVGALGKFGKVELSDVCAFVELAGGSVLSGSGGGALLLWEGGLIKAVLKRRGHATCHDGNVEALHYDAQRNLVLSAGQDGVVRMWDATKLAEAEAADDEHEVAVEPVAELAVGGGAHVRTLLDCASKWFLLDQGGRLLRATLPTSGTVMSSNVAFETLCTFHGAGVTALLPDRAAHVALSSSLDGALWAHDLEGNRPLATRRFATGITCMVECRGVATGAPAEVLLGHAGGFLRRAVRCADGWKLTHASRPHIADVVAICGSPDGQQVVSVAADGTAFFFHNAGGGLAPHAVVQLAAAPVAALWLADAVMVGYRDGRLLRVAPPQQHDHGAQATYIYEATLREGRVAVPDELLPSDSTVVCGAAVAQVEGGDRTADGEPAASDEAAEAAAQAGEDEDVADTPLLAIFPHTADPAFVVSLGGKAAGRMFACRFGADRYEPMPGMPGGVTCARHSPDGSHWLLGSADGAVRIYALQTPHTTPSEADAYWEGQLHDMHTAVAGVAMAFDASRITTAASDGSVLSADLSEDAPRLRPGTRIAGAVTSDLPTMAAHATVAVEDVSDAAGYTIEQAKQQFEEDALQAAAEEKKLGVRELLARIKRDFEQLLAENEARPPEERLPRAAFDIDPELRASIEAETAELERAAREEMRWESEKQRLTLAKLKARFLDDVEVERIVLYALAAPTSVTSFRTATLAPWVARELEAMRLAAEDAKLRAAAAEAEGEEDLISSTPVHGDTLCGTAGKLGAAGGGKSGVPKHEARKQARAARQAEWDAFLATKPSGDHMNADDAAAIERAQRGMGDFKLKADDDYVPPEGERMTAARKKQQIAVLEEGVHRVRMEYNERFLALRDVKRSLCERLRDKYARLAEANAGLGVDDAPQPPRMRPEEEPEKRLNVTDADVDAYLREQAAAGGTGGDGGARSAGAEAGRGEGAAEVKGIETPAEAVARMAASTPLSPLEKAAKTVRERQLKTQRARVHKEIEDMEGAFDRALQQLRTEKLALEADLKAAEAQVLVMWQEHALLVDFSKKDELLAGKLAEKHQEHNEVMKRMAACQEHLKEHRVELDGVSKKKAALLAQLDQVFDEAHPQREALVAIFKRKIKRSKKAAAESEEESSGDEEGDDEDYDDDDDAQELCPPGCEQACYDEVCALREQRLDQEDVVADITRACDAAKKEHELLKQKAKRIDQAQAATEADIEAFQREKQAALNEIEVTVLLRAHQIEHLVGGRLPTDLSGALVFSNAELARLARRIDELAAEKGELRKEQKELKKQHKQLARDKEAKEKLLAELDAKARDVQMLKFGREIDLSVLERMGPTPGADELQQQLQEQERSFQAELAEWDRKVAQRTEELVALTQENTAHLQTVAELTAQQKGLEEGISRAQRDLHADPVATRRREVAEREHLVQTVNTQAHEIDRLKSQITVLRRKDTSVYS